MKSKSKLHKALRQAGEPFRTTQTGQKRLAEKGRCDPFAEAVLHGISQSRTPDPFAMPETDDPFWFLKDASRSKHPFARPDPLNVGGRLFLDWNCFVCGPLRAFAAALGVGRSAALKEQMTITAAHEVLKDLKVCVDTTAPRPWAVGWLLGFGAHVPKQRLKWDSGLKDFAKVSRRLRRYLFLRASELVPDNIEAVRAFLNGFCDGVRAAGELEYLSTTSRWRLFVALKGREFASNRQIWEALKRHQLATDSQEREALRLLSVLRKGF